MRAARAGDPCLNPGCDRACESWRDPYHGNLGYCARCYRRWQDAGFPVAGPPARRRAEVAPLCAAGRAEDYAELRRLGLTRARIAERMRLSRRTLARYEARLRGAA